MKIIYNFIPINSYIIKSVYFMYYLKKVIIIFIKPKFPIYFNFNIANNYWVILLKKNNQNKTGFFIFNR